MAGFKFGELVKTIYESSTSSNYPTNTRSSTHSNWATAATTVGTAIIGEGTTGVTWGVPSQSDATFVSLGIPTALKNALKGDKMTYIHNGRSGTAGANPYWVFNNRLIVFGGSGTSGNTPDNETPRAQGDVAYEALKLYGAYLEANTAGRTGSGSDAETLLALYNTKLGQI